MNRLDLFLAATEGKVEIDTYKTAEILSISPATVATHVPEFCRRKIGKRVLYDVHHLSQWLANEAVDTPESRTLADDLIEKFYAVDQNQGD